MIYRQGMNEPIQNTAKAGASGREDCCIFHLLNKIESDVF